MPTSPNYQPGHQWLPAGLARGHCTTCGPWGQGLALEAARASLSWGWRNLDAPAATAVTVPANWRSRGLMERLGMLRDPGGDFDHPDMARGDPLRHHIRYRIARPVKPPLMS